MYGGVSSIDKMPSEIDRVMRKLLTELFLSIDDYDNADDAIDDMIKHGDDSLEYNHS